MAHGFSGVEEPGLDEFASAFARAGLAVPVFDYRFLGTRDGAPRQRIVPAEQREDRPQRPSGVGGTAAGDTARAGSA